jgi:hypothetical protein
MATLSKNVGKVDYGIRAFIEKKLHAQMLEIMQKGGDELTSYVNR